MKTTKLHATFQIYFFSLKNYLKILLSKEACKKVGPALKWWLLEHVTLAENKIVIAKI